jgi:hypothetical protein
MFNIYPMKMLTYKLFLESSSVDNILDKISEFGIGSLNDHERSVLDAQKGSKEDIEKSEDELYKFETEVLYEDDLFKFTHTDTSVTDEGIKYSGRMSFPNDYTTENSEVISGKEIEGYILVRSNGMNVPYFSRDGYEDFDFLEDLENDYDGFITLTVDQIESK